MDSDDATLEKLLQLCKSNDVDVKVDALTKLQAEFERGIQIRDSDSLITALKNCLRTSNQHLTAATLSALPPLLPLLLSRFSPLTQNGPPPSASSSTSSMSHSALFDIPTLRSILMAFLPAGGIIERLGDKERIQAKARETLVILGGMAYRSSGSSAMSAKSSAGKVVETPIMIYERFLRENGLASKVWKVREQSILTLVYIRRSHHQFPIRSYLSLLVDCLEDTDAHVRECARPSVIELFTGPGVTDAARADLKKELIKKGVRKTIVDGVLSKLIGGAAPIAQQSSEGSENGEASGSTRKEYVPPSLILQGKKPAAISTSIPRTVSYGSGMKESSRPPSRAAMASPTPTTPMTDHGEVQPVYIASSRDLESEFAAMQKPFEGKETEHNWAAREKAIVRVRGMLKGDVNRYKDTMLLAFKEGFIQWSLKTLASLRTTVSTNTCSLYSELAIVYGPALDPFCETLLTNLLRMAGFTKKITAQQSQASVTAIITHTSAQPRMVLSLLWNTIQEKTVQARAAVVAHLKNYLEVHGLRSRGSIESAGGGEILERSLKKALADPNPAVRENARTLFWVFEEVWRERALTVMESLDSVARKQLEKACPDPNLVVDIPPTTPKPAKKSSVAAAIAASRAKAKAIATAPPTLRHQATSASHVPQSRRSASPSISQRSPTSSTTGPISPLRMTTTSPTARSRIVPVAARSVSSPAIPNIHNRTPSAGSSSSYGRSPPHSPTRATETAIPRPRATSPLASNAFSPTRTPGLRRALQTALPASPPSSSGHVTPPRSDHDRSAPASARNSGLFGFAEPDDESLLLAQRVPVPEDDSDSEDGSSVNLMSFSAPFEMYPPLMPDQVLASQPSKVNTASRPSPPKSLGSSSYTPLSAEKSDTPVIEDALRARAEQAESAAERLLELVEPEDDQQSDIPSSLLPGSANGNGNTTPKLKAKPNPIPITHQPVSPPVTPISRVSAASKQAAMFQDSPAYNGRSNISLLDALQSQKQESGWWLKHKTLIDQSSVGKGKHTPVDPSELEEIIVQLQNDTADVAVLKKLALLCIENPVSEAFSPPLSPSFGLPSSPSPFVSSRSIPSFKTDIWEKTKNFERTFCNLKSFLQPNKDQEIIEYGLIVLWEMLENQTPYLDGQEGDLFAILLNTRYSNKSTVLEATNTIRDAVTTKVEPVYGLTTVHASLRVFYAQPAPAWSNEETKTTAYAFGLMALGKFILRLPAEIAEEELPRLKGTLITALNDKTSLIVRESAAACIIAAQLVLRDETHLFALLDGLADEKKNLLTYLFDKHGARGVTAATHSGRDRLEKELRRLDNRTSTPLRSDA